MPRAANGDYTAPVNSWNPAVEGTVIDPDDWNEQLTDYVETFTDSLSRTGDGGMLADLEMGNFALTEVGAIYTPVAALTLADGANANITCPAASFLRVAGPSNAFSLSGLTLGANGRRITIFNPIAQNMTITNSATSSAANQFLTMTGADLVSTGVCTFECIYSSADTKWVVVASSL